MHPAPKQQGELQWAQFTYGDWSKRSGSTRPSRAAKGRDTARYSGLAPRRSQRTGYQISSSRSYLFAAEFVRLTYWPSEPGSHSSSSLCKRRPVREARR